MSWKLYYGLEQAMITWAVARKNVITEQRNVLHAFFQPAHTSRSQREFETLSGVFNWVLLGLERLLQQQNFTESETVNRTRHQYKTESDSIRLFLEEEYIPHLTNYEPIKRLYSQYLMFCQEGGFSPVNQLNFQKRLTMSKVIVMKKCRKNRFFKQ